MSEMIDSGINNHLGRALFYRVNKSLTVEDILGASNLSEVHDGCVDFIFWYIVCENSVFMVKCPDDIYFLIAWVK